MAFLAAALPYITAAGAAYSAAKTSQAEAYNAKVQGNEANLSINQANQQEGLVRRASREQLGRQAAAFGAAGVGYGGSSGVALDQSAINAETDALNTRYKGAITAYGYRTQAGIDNTLANQYGVTAGAALLKGVASNYTYAPPQPSTAQAGVPQTS
jgi:hypothetical protein